MASDWIKMRTDIYRDPKVCRIADLIASENDVMRNVTRNVTRNAIVGALVTVWGVARQRGKAVGVDLVIANANEKVVDDIADLPGLGSSMLKSGWLIVDGNDLVFPRFFEDYNSPTSENKNAERQRRYREKRNVTRNVVSNVTVTGNREEKRREEKEEPPTPKPSKPKTLSDESFDRFWRAYPKRKAKGAAEKSWKALKPDAELVELILEAIEAQRQSDGWTKQNGEFIPMPATWLNQRRWEDETETQAAPKKRCLNQFEIDHGTYNPHGDPPFTFNTRLCRNLECPACKPKREAQQ